jgi:hypothetical protein
MYFTAYGPEAWFPDSSAQIHSALSDDGLDWRIEPGVRLATHPNASRKVYCPDVIPLSDGRLRMYYEAAGDRGGTSVLSAVSNDGIDFTPEPGVRFGDNDHSYGSPRCLQYNATEEGVSRDATMFRLYCHQTPSPNNHGSWQRIVSAVSPDGLDFSMESGVRIDQDRPDESGCVYAPEVVAVSGGGYRMYYAGWTLEPIHGRILSAWSEDGITWRKDPDPNIDIGGRWDRVKASEPAVIGLPDGRFRLYYEANDENGVWRIASATSK